MSKPLTEHFMSPQELRVRGFEVLSEAIGWGNAVRYVQQYEVSRLDYTKERDSILPDWDVEETLRQFKAFRATLKQEV